MASSTSSLSLSQVLLSRAISHQTSDHLNRLSIPTPLPAFSGLKSTSSSIPRASSSSRHRRRLSRREIRAAAVETVDVTTETSLVEKSINTIRFLAIDAVEKANSGHPGLPMGCAPMGHILYDEVMKYNPKNPYWFNRDRFVLSAGHGCMLQYALLHLAGYDSVQVEDLKQFRQWGSRTPGHPENFETPGVEVTTGPLGQGIANAVGLALAEKHLAARFNKPDNEIVDHYTYVILGDGCQMEGIANEACSLAGHWGLGKLIAFYDDNHISIDGDTEIAFTENVDKRFEGLGWHVIWVKNGNTGYDEIRAAIKEAKAVKDKPTMIKDCTVSSIKTNVLVEFTCKKCHEPKVVTLVKNEPQTTPLALQGQEPHNVSNVVKKIRFKLSKPSISAKTQESSSELKQVTPASSSATKTRSKISHWGVIWRKKAEDNGIEFRRKNILLRGDSQRIRPNCNLCKKEYNPELIYVHCESCDGWFHSEALELDEFKIHNIVGFKCCRCRRIRSPKCPYGDNPQGQKTASNRTIERASKKGKTGAKSDPRSIPEFEQRKPSSSQTRPVEELIAVEADDPLLFSLSNVEQITEEEEDPKVLEVEWDDPGQGPHKLPVRRHGKLLLNADCTFESSNHAEPPVPFDRHGLVIPKQEQLPFPVELDYDMNYEDMEFEPQTYFSFTELLDPDDGGQLEGDAGDASGNVLGYSEDQSCAVSRDGTGISNIYLVAPESSVDTKFCKMCSHTEPVPDLSCVNCNMFIHTHCSPWIESSSPEGSWRCGNCRGWR